MLISAVPAGTTAAQLMAAYEVLFANPNATPAPGGLNLAALPSRGGLEVMSPGLTAWPVVDLGPGTYAALCYVNDPETGRWHVLEGMVAVFSVA